VTHRFSWTIANGTIPAGMHVLHQCDNPACVRPDHLFLGDDEANRRDAIAKDRHSRGTRNSKAKLNDDNVRWIHSAYTRGAFSQSQIAAMFGISQSLVCRILRRERWKHVA
jgi:DNA-directed RNA polymerase specialized sigma subunit